MESISYDSFDRDEDGDNVMGRIEDDDCHNACEEEDGKKEAVEGRGHVVPPEGEQGDVDRGSEDPPDALKPHNSLAGSQHLNKPGHSSLRSYSGKERRQPGL